MYSLPVVFNPWPMGASFTLNVDAIFLERPIWIHVLAHDPRNI